MTRDICEVEIVWTNELYRWTLEHSVMLLAHETGVLDSFMDYVTDICVGADNTDVIFMCFKGVQGDVCASSVNSQAQT
jgi:hypothetical protein